MRSIGLTDSVIRMTDSSRVQAEGRRTFPAEMADSVAFGRTSANPDARRINHWISTLAAMPRYSLDQEGCWKTADYIKQQWQAMGLSVEEQTFDLKPMYATATEKVRQAALGKYRFKNVMTSFGPANADRIVIGAHYDTVKGSPGADDNATGVAAILELARLLQKHQPNLKTRIDLVAYPLEEFTPLSALYGSQMHARKLIQDTAAQGTKVKGMISLDAIGFYTDEENSQEAPSKLSRRLLPTTGNFVALGGDLYSKNWAEEVSDAIRDNSDMSTVPFSKVPRFFARLLAQVYRSDHASYRLKGHVPPAFVGDLKHLDNKDQIPAEEKAARASVNFKDFKKYVYRGKNFSDIPAIVISDTANMRNPHYHRTTDKPETVDPVRVAQVVKGLYGLIETQTV